MTGGSMGFGWVVGGAILLVVGVALVAATRRSAR
jgi:hypothetical protein